MNEKYNEKYEHQIKEMAESRIKSGSIKVFDHNARIVKRERFPELVKQGKTEDENCLIIINQDGECVVLTQEFERALMNVSGQWFEKY